MAIRGIIFDMDNTLLRSSIDFQAMKAEVADYLMRHEAVEREISVNEHTSSSIIAIAMRSPIWSARMKEELDAILTKHEVAGMEGAELEPGVADVIQQLYGRTRLVVLTNNAYRAAKLALENNGIDGYFDHIVAREQAVMMKPAPDGVHTIMQLFPDIGPQEWLSVGDSWIDGKAAQDAGVAFIAYGGHITRMHEKGIRPVGCIELLSELSSYIDG